jgi:hypothetical protein
MGLGVIYLFHTRRLTQWERHGSDYSNMIGVAGKTTNCNVFSASPVDLASGVSLCQFSHPSQHFLFGCFTGPMQSVTASYNSPSTTSGLVVLKRTAPQTTRSLR